MLVVIASHLLTSGARWPADVLHVLTVFLTAGCFFTVLFGAQMLLIHRIERGDVSSTG